MSSTKSNIVQCKNEQNKKFFTKRAITFHKNVYVYNDLTTINEPVLSIQWEEHPKLAHWSIKLSNNKPSKPNHISEWKKPVRLMKFKMWNATHVRELEKLVRGKRGGGRGGMPKLLQYYKSDYVICARPLSGFFPENVFLKRTKIDVFVLNKVQNGLTRP